MDKQELMEQIMTASERVLSDIMTEEAVPTGDASPEQVYELEQHFDAITCIYSDIIKQNTSPQAAYPMHVPITDDELEVLLRLLMEAGETTDSHTVDGQLLDSLFARVSNAAYLRSEFIKREAPQIFYVNIYKVAHTYGGAEEGGWLYTNAVCVSSAGFEGLGQAISHANSLLPHGSPYDPIATDDINLEDEEQRLLFYNIGYVAYAEPCDECTIQVIIEPTPAMSHDTRRRYFE